MFLRNKDAGFPLLSLNNYAEARRSCLQEVKLFSAHAHTCSEKVYMQKITIRTRRKEKWILPTGAGLISEVRRVKGRERSKCPPLYSIVFMLCAGSVLNGD